MTTATINKNGESNKNREVQLFFVNITTQNIKAGQVTNSPKLSYDWENPYL